MSREYIQPVILASDIEEAQKHKMIVVSKQAVYKDIDLITHKHADVHEDFGLRTENAVSSDVDEKIDASLISRYVEFRDSQIRLKMQAYLEPIEKDSATDDLSLEEENFLYGISVEPGFNDNTLKPLTDYIHRYLVYGALYDWFSQFGMQQAGVYGSQLESLENQISSILRGPSIAKRPLQPFGPKYPI